MSSPVNIVARVHAYPPHHNAGAEWTLHEMLRAAVRRGHTATVHLSNIIGPQAATYELDGVRVVPPEAGIDFGKAAARAGVLVSHLENVPLAACLARGHGIPLVVLCHNTFDLTWQPLLHGSTALAVLNSQWGLRALEKACEGARSRPDQTLVVRPPVWGDAYRTRSGDCITLVNCSEAKGVNLFKELARRMPGRKFLAVRGGYGEQHPPDLDNVLVLDHMPGSRMRDEVYARTRLLLMPSDYESWGRVGVEGIASGIPVMAHPTEGLRESLGPAGIFCDRGDVDRWQAAIEALDDPATYRAASRRAKTRSKALDPAKELDAWCDAIEELGRARTTQR